MKTYLCKKIHDNIIIDGDVKKPVWDDIDEVSLVDTMSGLEPKQKTYAKMVWNNEFLYVAFQCEDKAIYATKTTYNDEIYWEDVVEVFLDDNCDLKTYIEIEVNPINTLLHYSAQNDLKGKVCLFARVGQKIKTAVIRDDSNDIWSVELAIPLNEFVTAPNIPPKPGDKWLMNFTRIERPESGEEEFTAWSPTVVRRFHTPQKFGELIFTI